MVYSMESGSGLQSYVNKRIKVVYDDSDSSGARTRSRDGVLTGYDDTLLFLEQQKPYPAIAIARARLVRIEVLG